MISMEMYRAVIGGFNNHLNGNNWANSSGGVPPARDNYTLGRTEHTQSKDVGSHRMGLELTTLDFLDTGQFLHEMNVTDSGHVEVDEVGDRTGAMKNMNDSSIGSVYSAGLRERSSVVFRPGQYPVWGVWDARSLCRPEVDGILRGLGFLYVENLVNFGEFSLEKGKFANVLSKLERKGGNKTIERHYPVNNITDLYNLASRAVSDGSISIVKDDILLSELVDLDKHTSRVWEIMFQNQVDKILSLEEEKTALEEYTMKRKGLMLFEFENDATPKLMKNTNETQYINMSTASSVAQVALKIVDTGIEFVEHVLKTVSEKAKKIEEASIVGALIEVSGLAYIMGLLGLTVTKTVCEDEHAPVSVETEHYSELAVVKTTDDSKPAVLVTEDDSRPAVVDTEDNSEQAVEEEFVNKRIIYSPLNLVAVQKRLRQMNARLLNGELSLKEMTQAMYNQQYLVMCRFG